MAASPVQPQDGRQRADVHQQFAAHLRIEVGGVLEQPQGFGSGFLRIGAGLRRNDGQDGGGARGAMSVRGHEQIIAKHTVDVLCNRKPGIAQ